MRFMKRADAKDTESKDASELLGAGTGVAVFSPEDSSGAPAPAVGDKPFNIQNQNFNIIKIFFIYEPNIN